MYINWCFEIIFKKSESVLIASLMKCIFHLCSVHFLKLIITKVGKIKPNQDEEKDKQLQNDFIFAFTLLQNSVKIEEFSETFKHVSNIFNLKFSSAEYNDSMETIKQQLLDRNLTVIKYDEKTDNPYSKQIKIKNQKSFDHEIIIIDNDFSEDALKKISPLVFILKNILNNIKIR